MNLVSLRAYVLPSSLAATLLAAVVVLAQSPSSPRVAGLDPAKDPANLAGERVIAQSLADTLPIDHGAPALGQLLLKLRTRASLMLIVAHPDDEDGGMLAYESRGQGVHVAMLTLNRGEGGQNLMSGDFDDGLGLIRTQEILAAGRYMGNDQMFTSLIDFGFSKTREETLEQWGHDRVLYDTVRAVRLYRPLVLTSVFVGGVTDGHGQHQVAGQMNQEVFTAAADPKVFPEMGLPVWAPQKVYARQPFSRVDPQQGMFDYATGKYSPVRFYNYVDKKWSDTAPAVAVSVHEGDVSPALGMDGDSYVAFARKGLALQKSQNGGATRGAPPPGVVTPTRAPSVPGAPPRGPGGGDSGYARYGSRIPNLPTTEQSFFDGIDITLPGIATLSPSASASLHGALVAGLTKIDASTAEAQKMFDPAKAEAIAPQLRDTLKTLNSLIAEVEKSPLDATEKFNVLHELRVKQVQANNALVLAHGLTLEASLAGAAAGGALLTTQTSVAIDVKVASGSDQPIKVRNMTLAVMGGGHASVSDFGELAAHSQATKRLEQSVAKGLPATRPYFSRVGLAQTYYNISDEALRNAPSTPAPLTATAVFDDQGVDLVLSANVASPVRSGEAVMVVPPVSIALSRSAGIVPTDQTSFQLTTQVRSNATTSTAGAVSVSLPNGKAASGGNSNFSLAKSGEKADVTFQVPSDAISAKQTTLSAVATENGHTYKEGFRAIGYPGIPAYTNYYAPAIYRVSSVDVRTAPGIKVAYLPGTGDDVPQYLPDMGVTPTPIKVADLTAANLAQYDAVVLGVRAYAAHPELAGKGSQPLMDYATNGGVVIVQYNTSRYSDAAAPFPITVPGSSDMNVVEEVDPVKLLVPDSPVFTWPNHITSADFDHWVEERGHGFARSWGAGFQPLLEMHDPGQDEEKGGLLLAHLGKGYYIYTSLALYRQLPEGVPGAYRLFANLVSLGKNPGAK